MKNIDQQKAELEVKAREIETAEMIRRGEEIQKWINSHRGTILGAGAGMIAGALVGAVMFPASNTQAQAACFVAGLVAGTGAGYAYDRGWLPGQGAEEAPAKA